jgi:mRNA-degrading endonuclease toxin of MazEF toxin-antitoxin module
LEQNYNGVIDFSNWTKNKAIIKFKKKLPNFPITNNFIYWCNLGVNIGSEQNKIRPVIIVRNQTKSPICTILPLTSVRLNDERWYHIDLENDDSTVLIEQLRNVSKLRMVNPKRTNGYIDRITPNDLKNINLALSKYYKLEGFPIKK